jgi:hypothetical protein
VSDSHFNDSSAAAEDLTGIIRLVRRICLFREQGETARAAHLHADELLSAIAEYRLWHGPQSLTDEKLCVLFVNETEHVREAMALAAIVAPDLARLVQPEGPESEPIFPRIQPVGSIKPFPDGPPPITELLDGMMAAGRPATRGNIGDHLRRPGA